MSYCCYYSKFLILPHPPPLKKNQNQKPKTKKKKKKNNSKAEAADAARRSILTQILTPEAADRLGRIALVNAERARDVENRMIAMARSGQLRGRTTEDELLRLLAALRDRDKEAEDRGVGKVVFSRRKAAGWDDEEEDGVGVGYNN